MKKDDEFMNLLVSRQTHWNENSEKNTEKK